MKNLFCFLISGMVLFSATAFCQQSEAGSSGSYEINKENVNKLESFFEWVLGASFTLKEKQSFERQVYAAQKSGDTRSIEGFQQTLKVREQELALDEEKRNSFLQKARPLLYENFKKQEDSSSIILFGIYKRGQINLAKKAASNNASVANNIDKLLLGEWSQSYASTIGFSNGAGASAPPSGERVSLRFFSDGTFKSAYFNQSSLYGCTITVFGIRTGVYRINDKTVSMDEKTSDLSTKDNCNSSGNTEKHPPLRRSKYVYFIVQEADGPKLHLKLSNGTDDIFYREEGKGLLGDKY